MTMNHFMFIIGMVYQLDLFSSFSYKGFEPLIFGGWLYLRTQESFWDRLIMFGSLHTRNVHQGGF